jgi:hypothetical protein
LSEVIGEYQYEPRLDPGYSNIRRVKSARKCPRTKFTQGALYEIASAMGFFQVKSYADEFLTAFGQKDITPLSEEEEEEAITLVADNIERQSHDFVLKQISQRLKGHALAEFVGYLLLWPACRDPLEETEVFVRAMRAALVSIKSRGRNSNGRSRRKSRRMRWEAPGRIRTAARSAFLERPARGSGPLGKAEVKTAGRTRKGYP